MAARIGLDLDLVLFLVLSLNQKRAKKKAHFHFAIFSYSRLLKRFSSLSIPQRAAVMFTRRTLSVMGALLGP